MSIEFVYMNSDDISSDIVNKPSRCGYSYITLYLKPEFANKFYDKKIFTSKFNILYLTKKKDRYILYKECDLVMRDKESYSLTFKYVSQSKVNEMYNKKSYNQLKLKQMLKCY